MGFRDWLIIKQFETLENSPTKEIFTPNIKTKFKYSPNHDLLFYLVEMKKNVGSLLIIWEIGLNTH
jgi:hypothetical protein